MATLSKSVQLVDKDDARCVLFCLGKKIPDSRGPYANEHLQKIRTTDVEKGHPCLARNCFRKKCLAGAGGTDQQDALGNHPSQTCEFLRCLQGLDDLSEFLFGSP